MNEFEIKIASPQDMDHIMELVVAVFDGEQGIPAKMTYIPEEKQPKWWFAERDGRVIACVACWVNGDELHMGRFAVLPELRGQGMGKILAKRAIQDLFEEGHEILYMEARDATVHILLQMGAEVTGETFQFFGENETPMMFRKEKFIG